MEDNVVPMPSKLDRLAVRIRDDLKKRTESYDAWVTATLDLGACLVEARDEFPDNIVFGQWCDANAINLNIQDRASIISMAREPQKFAEVLGGTHKRSLQHIYYEEFRVSQPRKTIGAAKLKVTPPTQKAMDAIQKLRGKGVKITQKTVAKEAGVSETSVRRAFTIEQAVNAAGGGPTVTVVAEEEPEIDPASLPKTTQEKYEALKRRLEKDVDHRVNVLAREKLASLLKSNYDGLDKRVKECQRLLNRKHPFTRLEFKKLMMVAHPDNSASKEMRDEVFTMINQRELILQPDVETELADKAAKARLADMDRNMREAQAWFAANPGKKKWPGPGAK